MTEEVKSLQDILWELKRVMKKVKIEDIAVEARLPVLKRLFEPRDGPLAKCLTELGALHQWLASPSLSGQSTSIRTAFIQVLGWSTRKHRIRRNLANIGRFPTILTVFAITLDSASVFFPFR